MKERWFCRKKGIICPHASVTDQVRNCAEWDPRDVICDKTCRHATSAEEKKAERERLDFLKAEHPEMLREKKKLVSNVAPATYIDKDNEKDLGRTSAITALRLDLMKQQVAAAERIAAALEDIANAIRNGGTK